MTLYIKADNPVLCFIQVSKILLILLVADATFRCHRYLHASVILFLLKF